MVSQRLKWAILGLIGIAAGAAFVWMRMSGEEAVAVGMQRTNAQLETVLKREESGDAPKKKEGEAPVETPSNAAGGADSRKEGPAEAGAAVKGDANAAKENGDGGQSVPNDDAENGPGDLRTGGGPEASSPPKPAKSGQSGGGQIDLNTATLQQLIKLPGIGESKAKAIIAYREQTGGFRTAKEITKVKGIGDKTYEALKDLIAVSAP